MIFFNPHAAFIYLLLLSILLQMLPMFLPHCPLHPVPVPIPPSAFTTWRLCPYAYVGIVVWLISSGPLHRHPLPELRPSVSRIRASGFYCARRFVPFMRFRV